MTPIKHVITWLVESVVYVLVLIALFYSFQKIRHTGLLDTIQGLSLVMVGISIISYRSVLPL